jgi:hypothetical protein
MLSASSYPFDTIYTLEARSNAYLPVMKDHLDLSDRQVFNLIQGLFHHLCTLLASKGIEYSKLKGALVPNTGHRHERAFVFDWSKETSGLYGREAVHAILPVLDASSTHSVLCGDWLPQVHFGEMLNRLTFGVNGSRDGAEGRLWRHLVLCVLE